MSMPTPGPAPARAVDRRTVTTGLAWAVPAVTAVAAAPLAAASVIKVPGVNGWVYNPYTVEGCTGTLTATSSPGRGAPATADGAPYGLYLYDTTTRGIYTQAKMTIWVRGDHVSANPVTWRTLTGHSTCWSGPVRGAVAVKADGFRYTPYTWTLTCRIDPTQVAADGRLYLPTFSVTTDSFSTRSAGGACLPVDWWTERSVTVDPDGTGPQAPTVLRFERRNGQSGPYTAPRTAGLRAAGRAAEDASSTTASAMPEGGGAVIS